MTAQACLSSPQMQQQYTHQDNGGRMAQDHSETLQRGLIGFKIGDALSLVPAERKPSNKQKGRFLKGWCLLRKSLAHWLTLERAWHGSGLGTSSLHSVPEMKGDANK